ncbi:MAG: sulfotransferase family protein [Verrucomicrobiaceae bacterium]|nr:sulfotransferase family protein [Verrucomicrobiaceae bacterium]
MIISHKHRFIFIKTKKTAGTSIEIALSRFCGEDDVITPFVDRPDEEARQRLGYRGPQNYKTPQLAGADVDWGDFAPDPEHYNHEPAFILRQRISRDIWESYLKFSVERNPWDRAVSLYYFRLSKSKRSPSLKEFITTVKPKVLTNFRRYAIDDTLAVDHVMRYENVDLEMLQIGQRLRLPESLELPDYRAKGQFRADKRHYRELMGEEERDVVAKACAKEIELFGYEF